jgi:undecaprenyl-diphosphatase
MARIARRVNLPLLVLPGGTFNHFARATGAVTVNRAIDALQAGAGLSVDVAEATVDEDDPITVLNTVSIGIYPEFVDERDRHEDTWTKWGAALLALGRLINRLRPITVVLDGRRATAWSVFVAVGRHDPRLVSTLQRRALDDRVLDVRVLHAGASRVRAVGSLIFGRRTSAVIRAVGLMPERSRIESFTTAAMNLIVRARDGVLPPLAHDGELVRPRAGAASFALRVRIVPDGLLVYSLGPDTEP